MHIGERIKRIRTFRNMTQAELGLELGFDMKNATVRVAQYESNYRVPKEDMINTLADILNVSPMAIRSYSDISEESIMESLFWLEEEKGYDIISLTELEDVYANKDVKHTYDATKQLCSVSPISLVFGDEKLSMYMYEWYLQKKQFIEGTITSDEYFQWKLTWPRP